MRCLDEGGCTEEGRERGEIDVKTPSNTAGTYNETNLLTVDASNAELDRVRWKGRRKERGISECRMNVLSGFSHHEIAAQPQSLITGKARQPFLPHMYRASLGRTRGSSGLMSLSHAFCTSHLSRSFFVNFLNLAFEVPIVLASQ